MAFMTSTMVFQPDGQQPTGQQDEFDSEQFEGGHETLPYIQMLNHQNPDKSGFFITLQNMEAAGFIPNEEWTPHTEQFQSGETAEGYRSLTARFLILRKSKLMMFERESDEFLGAFQKFRYDRNTVVLKTRYLVYLVSKSKVLFHTSPLLLTAKGSFNGCFGEVVRKFQSEMSKAYGIATGARKPRGDRFMALSILAVRVKPELKGDRKKSWACSIETYGSPTADTWKSYFVGYNERVKEKILGEFEDWAQFGSLERELQAQQRRFQGEDTLKDSESEHYAYDEDF
ncbi:hypothetical protein H6F93_22535 [Leptolyngbya sp. FACHB-671]|uniref:DUF5895 domain-containing protein n=1 Tax=Leptolyngbya sp. FACHB-671 TaxID=2692812 RepID=UPI001683795B|nr:DUF5895 domain-containing protein [Leptolyngbya sp. FACHB-671]MBD2070254.1 hypothetical protein [Leptolyngbya sp. FACHB-671]